MAIPRYKSVTIKTMTHFCLNHSVLKKYLPTLEDNDDPHIDRRFLVSIINTVDPTYFPHKLRQIEDQRKLANERVQKDLIEVQPEILTLLETYGSSHIRYKNSPGAARAFAALKTSAKKRTYANFAAKPAAGGAASENQVSNNISTVKRFKI